MRFLLSSAYRKTIFFVIVFNHRREQKWKGGREESGSNSFWIMNNSGGKARIMYEGFFQLSVYCEIDLIKRKNS